MFPSTDVHRFDRRTVVRRHTRGIALTLFAFCTWELTGHTEAAAQSALTPNTIRLDSGFVSQPARIGDFAFLTGHWTGPGLGGETDELWSAPAAGTMTGTFRLIQGGKVVFYEFFALEEHEGTVVLRLKHFDPGPGLRGWEQQTQETLFRLVRVGDGTAWFHGLTYRMEGPDTLVIFLALRGADQVLREETFRLKRAVS